MNTNFINTKCVIDGDFARVIFDKPNSSVNVLCSTTVEDIDAILSNITINSEIKGVVFESAKENCFIAGADINEIATITDKYDATAKASIGQNIITKIANLKIPTYAIINGACMGGGLEFALACDVRIAIQNPKTKLSLPEVNLGFIPGFGGTQRLPRVVGIANALDMICTGKAIDAKKAKKIKLVDEICSANIANEVLKKCHKEILTNRTTYLKKIRYKPSTLEKYLPSLIFKVALKKVKKASKGFYPAPVEAINVIRKTYNINIAKGLEVERRAFGHLASGEISKNLVQLFFTNEALRKEFSQNVSQIESVGVVGSGIMGGGIAFAFSTNGLKVRMKDITLDAIALGYKQIKDCYKSLIKRRKICNRDAGIKTINISSTLNYSGFNSLDMVIEAVVEDLPIKHNVLQDLEMAVKKNCIIATNTSSLRVEDISQVLARKENVVGMHFFNPVNKMPLVEVVKSQYSSMEAVAKVMQLARKCGKIAIPVGDCNGFIVNRILMPFMNEALLCFEETSKIAEIDAILKKFGMPMGAFELADEIGLDVCHKVSATLYSAYGIRMKPAITLDTIYKQKKLLGKKGKKGFYINGKVNQGIINPSHHNIHLSNQEILDRLILIMVNEAGRILEEGHIKNPQYLDMCMIMGAGFPAFRGGILKYADSIGIEYVCSKLRNLSNKYGERFKPCNLITKLSEEKKKFYDIYKL